MSYCRIIKVDGELDKKFKPSSLNNNGTDQYKVNMEKRILSSYCMVAMKKADNTVWSTQKIYESILMQLKMIQCYVKDVWCLSLQSSLKDTKWSEENEVEFNGWQYSDSGNLTTFDNENDIIDYYIDNIFRIVSAVEVPDYFSNSEKWYDYYNEIKENIDGFEESLIDFYDNEFIDFYRDCTVKHNEDEPTNDLEEDSEC